MNARSGSEDAPMGPVRKRLARLIEPAVPRQTRRRVSEQGWLPLRGRPREQAEHSGGAEPDASTGGGLPDGSCAEEPAAPSGPGSLGGARSGTVDDPLDDPDPARAADAAAVENLLRCWVRENDLRRPEGGVLELPLEATGIVLRVPVRYWSQGGWHRFGRPLPVPAARVPAPRAGGRQPTAAGPVAESGAAASEADEPAAGQPAEAWSAAEGEQGAEAVAAGPAVDAVTLAALLGRESAHRARRAHPAHDEKRRATQPPGRDDAPRPGDAPSPDGDDSGDGPDDPAQSAELVGRVADSVRRTAEFLADRRSRPQPPPGTGAFLDAEQSLLLGHPLHPTPKSREGLSDAEARVYSPELRGAFPLHWLAVDRSVLACESAWTEDGSTVPAEELAARIAGEKVAGRAPAGTVPLPLHPWQARELWHRPEAVRLLTTGLLHDLGPGGDPWHPTSSVRTVVRPDGPAMLKLSLGVRITNSRRENLRKELLRGVEVHRLLHSGLGARWSAAHPGFDIVRDPAWLGVDGPDGTPVPGLDTVVRQNPFTVEDDAVCLAGLVSPRPQPDGPSPGPGGTPWQRGGLRSRLAGIVEGIAASTGRSVQAVSTEWFLRYLDTVVRPVLWLDAHAGIALEAHQQNTLVLLDDTGWPIGGRYRDNQGYYFRASRRSELEARLPGRVLGVASDSFVEDAVTDERFAYYLGINNILGLVGAFGAQQLADERLLLAALRRFLGAAARPTDGEPVSPLPALLLDSPTLRCKANLLTRLQGLDELVGPVDTQSVYVTLSNPLAVGSG